MTGLSVAFVFFLLADLVLDISMQPFHEMLPDAQFREMPGWSGGPRRAVQRQKRSTLPLYMVQLYRTMRNEDRARSPTVSSRTWREGIPGLHDSDSVISLVAKSCQQTGELWSVTFDLSFISPSDNIQLAEFHIRLPAFDDSSSSASVDIYHSNQEQCSSTGCSENRLLLGHLRDHSSSVVSPSLWKVFNITKMLRRWLHRGPATQKIGEDIAEVKEENEQQRIKHPTADSVMMVVFFKQSPHSQRMPTLICTAEHSKYVSLDREEPVSTSRMKSLREKRQEPTWQRPRDAAEEKEKANLCRKVDMWVDFDKLNWSEWILYPKRYNAYCCEGTCPTPVDETFAPTNHAYIQSLLKHQHEDKVPNLSCVPTRLAPLSMLYYENGTIVVKHYGSMVVEECGCH